ncbi:MAG TPA: phytanoyl-CoA dioxygenase family protein [Kofleriaceae bacterium]|nr:phytanoyl-CoA dioxygenase family protein [Kofleriaceae bacterium]
MKQIIADSREYLRAELAHKYKSTAGTQDAIDPETTARDLAAVERDGFVIIERLIPRETCDAIKADMLPRFRHASGRNNFEGFATRRLYAVIEKTLACNPLVEHPRVLALLDRILAPNYLLSQLQVIDILPGEAAQPLHHDDGFYPIARPRPPLGAATIFAIDDFTADNGATVVIPRSHTWDDRPPRDDDARVKVVMPAGSMVFFVGTLWHGGGANTTDRSRMCVTAQYCAPWCRQQENFSLSVSRERAKQCSEHVQRMLGYSIHPPFVGFVDGMHPKRLLE